MIHTSIIIPSLHSPWIGDVIDALRRQSSGLNGVEIIVIGLDKFGLVTDDAVVKFISTEVPVSPAKARNIGIKVAQGELLCFLDADCIPTNEWLEQIHLSFQDPSVNVVGGVIRFPHDFWTLTDTIAHFSNVIEGVAAVPQRQLPTLNFCVRREVFEVVGYFDETFPRPSGEDTELTKRMVQHGYRLSLDPHIVIFHLPKRKGLIDICVRAYHHGQAAGVPSFRQQLMGESFLLYWPVLLLTAVPRATFVSLQLFNKSPFLWQYWYTLPFVLLLKLIWIVSASIAMSRADIQKAR